ncbi:hypothetical protein QS257_14165 [Terrilactibacillus sp. S3-3]|nr:hypothetical protein QS257_14165 [Terrilactibacillus sp. S3-3]
MLEEGKSEPDSSKRKAIYNKLQRIWQKDMPVLTLYSNSEIVSVAKNVAHGGPTEYWPGTVHDLQDWSFKK